MIRQFVVRTQGVNTRYLIDTEKCFVQSCALVSQEEMENSINYCLLEGYEIQSDSTIVQKEETEKKKRQNIMFG